MLVNYNILKIEELSEERLLLFGFYRSSYLLPETDDKLISFIDV